MLLLLSALLLADQAAELNGDQLMRMLQAIHSEIRDFECVCEGESTCPGAQASKINNQDNTHEWAYQASYAYRADGAACIDLYQKPLSGNSPFLHKVFTHLGDKVTKLTETPDSTGRSLPPTVRNGGPGAFSFLGSPERFLLFAEWLRIGYSTNTVDYKYEGWEEIGGNAVIRFAIDPFPKSKNRGKHLVRYWLDLNRTGHVLKYEWYFESNLRDRMHHVELAQFPTLDGKQVWFPIRAEFDSFESGVPTTYSHEPVFHETYSIVRGSLVLNRGLRDDFFTGVWKGRKPVPAPLQNIRKQFSTAPKTPEPPPMRRDPAGIEQYQEKQLAEANRQAEQLDASPPGRRGWDLSILIQGGVGAIGVGAIVAAWIMKRRVA